MKTGTSSQLGRVLPGLSESLARAVLGDDYGKPRERRPIRLFNGKHPVQGRGDAANDALILEVRRLHEQTGMMPKRITSHLAERGHIKTQSWVNSTCNYYNRSFLVPAANADSYLPSIATEKPTP